jgi:hypothetical protein
MQARLREALEAAQEAAFESGDTALWQTLQDILLSASKEVRWSESNEAHVNGFFVNVRSFGHQFTYTITAMDTASTEEEAKTAALSRIGWGAMKGYKAC